MKLLAAAAALVITVAGGLAPALARDSYVIDNANLFSSAAVAQINAKVGDFNAQTHKEVVVVTVPSFTGTAADAEEHAFAQQRVNGVMIYVAKSPKTIAVIPDRVASHFFPAGSTAAIRQAIVSAFNSGDFNGGINNGVDLTLAEYRSHLGSLRSTSPVRTEAAPVVRNDTGGGFNMSIIWWLIALAVIFFIVRGIFRAIAGPRMMPPGYGGGMGGPMGGGYGPGYGGGGFGGGGGFWSGMLGGLGGAFLGNELFGNRGGGEFNQGGQQAGFGGEQGQSGGGDSSGWQSDAGQADMGNASSGGFGGDSGGGGWGDTGGGGGGGDWGGGGGGDGGGGGW